MELTEGWYAASFFLGAGCTVGIDANGKQICDFNNDKGVLAGEAFKTFTAHPSFISGDNSVITGGIGRGREAVVRVTLKNSDLAAAGETIPAQTYVDPICITADNVAEYLANGQAFQ